MNVYNNFQIRPTDPLFIAAEIFRDTLLSCGVAKESAHVAYKTFYCLQLSEKQQN